MISRRRLRRIGSNIECNRGFTKKDSQIYAYYLLHFFEYFKTEIRIDSDNDIYNQFFNTLMTLIKRSNLTQKASLLLDSTIKQAVKEKKLTLSSKKNECFYETDIKMIYEEDKTVSSLIFDHERHSLLYINLNRCAYCYPNSFFPQLLIDLFFATNDDIVYCGEIPDYLKKIVKDVSLVKFLKNSMNLSLAEAQLLVFLYKKASFLMIDSLFEGCTIETCEKLTLKILGISRKEYNKIVREGNKLFSFGFIENNRDCLVLSNDFVDCIQEQSLDPFFSDLVTIYENPKAYSLKSFNIEEETKTLMKELLKGNAPVSLLLYGKPGSGKTEFAKALARESGLKVMIFKNEKENSKETKIYEKIKCFLSMKKEDSVLIVDEADTILHTLDISFFGMHMPSKNKGVVNKILEENENKVIWIVNFKNQIDTSTLRRFNFSCKFENMTSEQLRKITQKKLKPLNLQAETESEILDLLSKYNLTGASSENIIKTIKCLGSENKNLVTLVHKVVKENANLTSGKKSMRQTVSSSYDIGALNTSQNPDEIVEMIKNAEKFAEKNPNSEKKGIRMLFYGLSGTGKTEFARYISTCLGKDILLKCASDILDKYVGESEKHIKEAFKEAEETNSILLFDEADSFFADRNNATHSWERTQVNEFLTQMEEFSGILICTTNLKKIMDSALNRRFHMIVEFKSLTEDGLDCMLERYFGEYKFTEKQKKSLFEYNSVTPGDFGVLYDKIRFVDAAKISAELIYKELCKIQNEKNNGDNGNNSNRKIGFSS